MSLKAAPYYCTYYMFLFLLSLRPLCLTCTDVNTDRRLQPHQTFEDTEYFDRQPVAMYLAPPSIALYLLFQGRKYFSLDEGVEAHLSAFITGSLL